VKKLDKDEGVSLSIDEVVAVSVPLGTLLYGMAFG